MPAVDVVESEKAYEITAELPSMGEKNIEVKAADGVLITKSEKREETEKRRKTISCRNDRGFSTYQTYFGQTNPRSRIPVKAWACVSLVCDAAAQRRATNARASLVIKQLPRKVAAQPRVSLVVYQSRLRGS